LVGEVKTSMGAKMEIKIDKKRNLRIVHHLLDDETYKINKGRKYNSISIYRKPVTVKGVSSYCGDGKHCLFIDYDNCPLWLIKQDFLRLQRLYGLPQTYLFKTKEKREKGDIIGNYHVISISKHTPKQIYQMLSETHADINFMSMPLRNKYRNWILRVSPKVKRGRPKFVEMLGKSTKSKYKISLAHLNFLKKLYPNVKHPKFKNTDKLDKIYLQEYETLNF